MGPTHSMREGERASVQGRDYYHLGQAEAPCNPTLHTEPRL